MGGVGSDPLGAPQEFHGFQPCLLPRIGAIGGNFELLYTRKGKVHRLCHPPTQNALPNSRDNQAPDSNQIGQQISHLSMVFEATSRLSGGQIPETESLVPGSRQSVVTVR
jgi:hypothetical protein